MRLEHHPEAIPDDAPAPTRRRTYVIDTSVLLADPGACFRFAEHDVVIPLVVLTELEAKRHHPELGWAARQSLRLVEDLRIEHGSLTTAIPANDVEPPAAAIPAARAATVGREDSRVSHPTRIERATPGRPAFRLSTRACPMRETVAESSG